MTSTRSTDRTDTAAMASTKVTLGIGSKVYAGNALLLDSRTYENGPFRKSVILNYNSTDLFKPLI